MLEDFLLQVRKPARYIGSEWNCKVKNFADAGIKFALCFPDLYEIGMSNLGFRIIYGILNSQLDVSCERFFSPDFDMENALRKNGRGIRSLESQKPMKEFDFLGFSLAYELSYTNVLNLLDLGGIPLEANLRTNKDPLVIAGGPCVLNPEPMHKFFDFFVLGEAEEVILEITGLYRKIKEDFKSQKLSRNELLSLFSKIEGIYVPSFYEIKYNENGSIKEFLPCSNGNPPVIKKRFIKNLDSAFYPSDWLLPYIQIVHDRITLEVMRGCPNSCRFCQARSCYYPLRYRKLEDVFEKARAIFACTGYEEISLAGLSVSEYPNIEKLMALLINYFKQKGVSIALPSIKPKDVTKELANLITNIKKTGFTFAPESASQRLRKIINKDFDKEEFLKCAQKAFELGYRHIKLYFMIGLPFEEAGDLEEILYFSQQVSDLKKQVNGAPAQINISISTLIPKPHTPLQWFAMNDVEMIKSKQGLIRDKAKKFKRFKISLHNPLMSFLEAVFSRGDRRLSDVVLSAFERGARFDAWGNHFVFDKWQESFRECNINPDYYLNSFQRQQILPWDFLDTGISKNILLDDFEKVIAIK